MRWVYQYPETNGTAFDMLEPGPVDVIARAAEDAGFMGFSLTEHPAPGVKWLEAGGHQSLDPFVGLAFAASATNRIRLLTYLSVAPYRNPLLLAKTTASLDKLSGGRLTLGLGAGYLRGEFRALGIDFEERNALFDEALEVLPLHWKGDPFSYRGIHFEAKEVIGRPRPEQDPIPIWIGGNSKLTRKRVAEKAQGWMPLVLPPAFQKTVRTSSLETLEDVAVAVSEIRAGAAGRGEPIDVIHPYNDPSLHDDPGADIAKHREAIDRLDQAGVTWGVVSGRTRSQRDTIEFIESFGVNYIQR